MIDDATKTVVVLRVTNIEIYCFMENNQQQILSEIKTLMASVRSQLEELDAKIVQWQQIVEPNEVIDVTSVIDGVEFYVDAPKEADDDLPFFDLSEENVVEEKPVEPLPVIDTMTRKHAWRTAMPGTPVKDIRGAIALMDRVLFINTLFGTDPMAFQETLTQINQMQTLEEVVGYLSSTHPEWDFDSDVVYSFMMAVRRKVNA